MKSVLQINVPKPSNIMVVVLSAEQNTFTERLERYKNILESINRSYIMQD